MTEGQIQDAVDIVTKDLDAYERGEIPIVTPAKDLMQKVRLSENTLRKYLEQRLTSERYELYASLIRSRKGIYSPSFGKKASLEVRRQMSITRRSREHYLRGKYMPLETRQKLSLAKIGKYVGEANPFFGKKHSPAVRELLRKLGQERWKARPHPFLGHTHAEATKQKIRLKKLGVKMSMETRSNMSAARRGRRYSERHRAGISRGKKGPRNPNWAGGVTTPFSKMRGTREYREWRAWIFRRDDFTCKKCGQRGGYLEADHYPISYASIMHELINQYGLDQLLDKALASAILWDISNGRTLCKKCHRLRA